MELTRVLLDDRKGRIPNATTAQLPADPHRRETESFLFSQILVDLVINSVMEQ